MFLTITVACSGEGLVPDSLIKSLCGYRKTRGKQGVFEGSGSVLDPILYRILYRVNRLAFMRDTAAPVYSCLGLVPECPIPIRGCPRDIWETSPYSLDTLGWWRNSSVLE